MTDSEFERVLDARVMRRLATDSAYRNAENAEEQAEREREIEDEEVERLEQFERELNRTGYAKLDTVTQAEKAEAFEVVAELEAIELEAGREEPEIVFSWTEPCRCGQVHPV